MAFIGKIELFNENNEEQVTQDRSVESYELSDNFLNNVLVSRS